MAIMGDKKTLRAMRVAARPVPSASGAAVCVLAILLTVSATIQPLYGQQAQYGSLGTTRSPAAITPGAQSYLVAQNTLPAAIAPTPATIAPATIAPPVITGVPPIDPYAVSSPGSTTLFAQSGIDSILPKTYDNAKRFRDRTSVDFLYIAPTSSDKKLGVTEIDLRCQFAIPLRCLAGSSATAGAEMPYLYLAPGAAFDWFTTSPAMQFASGFPETVSTYAAYLDVGVQPRLNSDIWVDAWVRVGIFSDYRKTSSKSVRVMGRAMGMFSISKEWDGAIGIVYINREQIKLLPSGGLIWHPNADTLFKLTFPDPKLSKRIKATSDADIWVYLQGNYGGGVWTITDVSGTMEPTDYNDIRLGIGLELENKSRFSGFFEFGGAFGRELYRSGRSWSAENTWYLRTGIVF